MNVKNNARPDMADTTPTRPNPKPLIVVVEDEPELASLIAQYLERAGMRVQVCNRAGHAIKFLQKNFANLVLLDLVLPDQPGLRALRGAEGREHQRPGHLPDGQPVEEASKVHGLDLGRRRLRHEALQLRRAGRPHPGGPAPGRVQG